MDEIDDVTDNFVTLRTESEERLMMCICSHPERLAEVAAILDPLDISDPFYAKLYQLSVDLFEAEKFSQHSLRSQLRKHGYLRDTREVEEFRKLFDDYTSGVDAVIYAREIVRLRTIYKVKLELLKASAAIQDPSSDPVEIVEKLGARLEAVSARQYSEMWETCASVAERVIVKHQRNLEGVGSTSMPTGFYGLDQGTGGFFKGQLWQIAARSYIGKTAAALNFTMLQVSKGNGVYFASYEMENEELMERILSAQTGVRIHKFSVGEIDQTDLQRLMPAAESFQNVPLLMDQKPPDSIKALRARVRLAQNVSDISLLVIDHLGMFPHTDRRIPRHQQLVEVTREMKAMAKDLGITVLLLNQLNTDADGEKPTDKHYAESKGIITNLDVSILLHRDTKTSDEMLCICTKSRRTKPFESKLHFDGEIQRLIDLTQPELDF